MLLKFVKHPEVHTKGQHPDYVQCRAIKIIRQIDITLCGFRNVGNKLIHNGDHNVWFLGIQHGIGETRCHEPTLVSVLTGVLDIGHIGACKANDMQGKLASVGVTAANNVFERARIIEDKLARRNLDHIRFVFPEEGLTMLWKISSPDVVHKIQTGACSELWPRIFCHRVECYSVDPDP